MRTPAKAYSHRKSLNCSRCSRLFSVDCYNQVVFCNGTIGKVVDFYANKQELLQDFLKTKKSASACPPQGRNSISALVPGFLPEKKIKNQGYFKKSETFYLFVTRACNNKCLFCFSRGDRASKDLNIREILKIISNIKETHVALFGGEPTVYPNILAVIRALKAENKKIIMTTNGRMFSDNIFSQKILAENISQISVSVHSHIKKSHELLCGTGSFLETIKGIRNIVANKNAATALRFNVVVNRVNYKQLPELARFVDRYGADAVRFNMLSPVMRKNTIQKTKFVAIEPVKTIPYLLKAMDYIVRTKRIALQVSNYPLCYFPRKYWKYLVNDRLVLEKHSNYTDNKDGVLVSTLASKCIDCTLKKACPGVKCAALAYYGNKLTRTLQPFHIRHAGAVR